MKHKDFEIIVRGLVIKDGRILVCKTENRDYFFLPGGHVEFGENMRKALNREFMEETGLRVKKSMFIGTVENIFLQRGSLNHELNFVFLTELNGHIGTSKEDHLTFLWFSPFDLTEEKFVPPALRNAILKWIADKKPFFILTEEEDESKF